MIISEEACELALVKRGWDEVQRVDGLSKCWEVRGAHTGSGYIQVSVTPSRKVSAHRVAHMAWNSQIPDGLLVRHRCDNPPCVNPEHLELGTHKQNAEDKISRGRSLKGSKHPMAKLSEEDARNIVHLRNSGVGSSAIGEKYGVTRAVVKKIVSGVLWGFATEDIPRSVPRWEGQHGDINGSSRLTADKVRDVVIRYRSGERIQPLSEEYGVTYQSVWNIVNGKTWTKVTSGTL